ncbi:N-6 DNA methylase [Nocardia barduliensis]|uniref:N-6 DNA methylase n=1 Tax=Nocardia barduliensis TaxID=2736643 RepID=UPI0015728F51|nr:N-6 DNA methylase [Nocardia barduliensis]
MDTPSYLRVIAMILALRWASGHPSQLLVPENARWERLVAANSPWSALHRALTDLVHDNPDVFGDSFTQMVSNLRLSETEAWQLISIIDDIPMGADTLDADEVSGQVFDEILAVFGHADKRSGLSTPPAVAELMARLADPRPCDSVYDPCTGTGGLLIAAEAYVRDHTGQSDVLALFGQDASFEAPPIARLNLMMHGVTNASVLHGDALIKPSYRGTNGDLRRFKRVVTTPPVGLKFRPEMMRFPEQAWYGQSRTADLMFVQHVLASLASDGVGVVAVPYGVLFRGGDEGNIRSRIAREGRIAAVIELGRNLFYGTSVPICLLVLRGAADSSDHHVLFINAEHEFETRRSKNYLAPRHVEKIAVAFRKRMEIPGFARMVSIEEIAANEFNLSVSNYIDPQSASQARLSINALLDGGVPADEVYAQLDRFAAFGINLAELFLPGDPGYFNFPPNGYETTAATITTLTMPTESAFVTAVAEWFEAFRQQEGLRTDRPPAVVREYFAGSFQHALADWTILSDENLVGLFIDWWTTNKEDLNQLRRPARSPNSHEEGMRSRIFDRIGADLVGRAKRLVAQERNQLVDIYLAFGDRYKTSLKQLEHRREQASSRLAAQLRRLGYEHP